MPQEFCVIPRKSMPCTLTSFKIKNDTAYPTRQMHRRKRGDGLGSLMSWCLTANVSVLSAAEGQAGRWLAQCCCVC